MDEIEQIERETMGRWVLNGHALICERCGGVYVPSQTSDPRLCGSCVPLRHIPLRKSDEEELPPDQKKCIVCFSFFEPKHPKQIYCGDRCRKKAAWRRRSWSDDYSQTLEDRAADRAFERKCAVCGGSLTGLRKDAKFCASKCRKKAMRRRTKGGRELDDKPEIHARNGTDNRVAAVITPVEGIKA